MSLSKITKKKNSENHTSKWLQYPVYSRLVGLIILGVLKESIRYLYSYPFLGMTARMGIDLNNLSF